MRLDTQLLNLLKASQSDGRLQKRETITLEFKENFNIASLSKYARTMAAFANNQGGTIVFGVTDVPRYTKGMQNTHLEQAKDEEISRKLGAWFAPEILFEIGTLEYEGKRFGYIHTFESTNKPVVAIKDEGEVHESDIYYRYYGQTRKIKYADLKHILDIRRKKEAESWMAHLEQILRAGPLNVGVIDFQRGSVTVGNGNSFLLDRKLATELLKNVQLIKEGSFDETSGTPVLKLIGDLSIAQEVEVPDIDPDIKYPYLQSQLAEMLGITLYCVQSLVWCYQLKGKRIFHTSITTSKSGEVHKFSEEAYQFLKTKLDEHKDDNRYLGTLSFCYSCRKPYEGN